MSQTAFESSGVSKVENPLTVNQLARQLLPLKVTNKEIDSGLKRVSKLMFKVKNVTLPKYFIFRYIGLAIILTKKNQNL